MLVTLMCHPHKIKTYLLSVECGTILCKFGQQQLDMVNYARGFNQSETGNYFEWIVIIISRIRREMNTQSELFQRKAIWYLALINRAEGLCGESCLRSWVQTESSEVCKLDRGQDSPIQTDYTRLIRRLLYGKQEQFNSFDVTDLY